MKASRPYQMKARAESAQRTRDRIVDAAQQLLWERLSMDVRLDDIAARAGVTVQTVLRRFGRRDELLEEAGARLRARITAQREAADPGDITGSIAVLFDHYEEIGDLVVLRLAEEGRDPELDRMLAVGRTEHRRWVCRQFGPQLQLLQRSGLVDALAVVCDVYAWKLLRRDFGRSREQAEAVMAQTVRSLLRSWPPS
jgi:AcrR family transcriptional regulator